MDEYRIKLLNEVIKLHREKLNYHQAEINRLDGELMRLKGISRKERVKHKQAGQLDQWKKELNEIKQYLNKNFSASILELADHLRSIGISSYNADKLRRNFMNHFTRSEDFLVEKLSGKVMISLTKYN